MSLVENKKRTSNIVDPKLLEQIGDLLQNEYMQKTPLQTGTMKKIGELLGNLVDKFTGLFTENLKINYKSDEVFGLVAFIGKEQQLHIRGYVDGRIESEIEPLMHHYEHLMKPPEYEMFNGMWYSAHGTVEYLLNNWDISSRIEQGDSGVEYHPNQWRKFSKPDDFYTECKSFFSDKTESDRIGRDAVIDQLKQEIQRIKKSRFSCLIRKALHADDFKSYRAFN